MNKTVWVIEIHPELGYVTQANFGFTKDPKEALQFETQRDAWFYAGGDGGGKVKQVVIED